jgi:hypothetical protein
MKERLDHIAVHVLDSRREGWRGDARGS